MSVLSLKSYLDASNTIKLQLKDNSSGSIANTNLQTADTVSVVVEGVEYDSDTYPTSILWTDAGIVTLHMYDFLTTAGIYDCHILVYFGGSDEPMRWDDSLRIAVK